MKFRKNFGKKSLFFLSGLLWFAAVLANAVPTSPKKHQMKVSLFGAPCVLEGPFEEVQLKAVHAISPEQNPQPQGTSQVVRSIQNFDKNKNRLPAGFETYTDLFAKHLKAMKAFYDAIAKAKNQKSLAVLLPLWKPLLAGKEKSTEYGKLAELLKKNSNEVSSPVFVDEVMKAYQALVEPYPESDFHRVIRKLGIQYSCSFEEGESESEDAE